MQNMPLVSVIIPTYNRSDLLQETVASVLAQTYSNIEVLVVDDGSTDDTETALAAIPDARLIYIAAPHTGLPSTTRNIGLARSHGEYIAFVDSDDLWLPEKIEYQLNYLQKNLQYAWCFCNVNVLSQETGKLSPVPSPPIDGTHSGLTKALARNNFIASPTPFIQKTVLDEVGTFDESWDLRFSEDWELWLRIAAKYNPGYINTPLAHYRWHGNNATNNINHFLQAKRRGTAILKSVQNNFSTYAKYCPLALETHCVPHLIQLLYQGELTKLREILKNLSSLPQPSLLRLLSNFAKLPDSVILTTLDIAKKAKGIVRYLLQTRQS